MGLQSRRYSPTIQLLIGLAGALLLPHISLAQTENTGGYRLSENSVLEATGTDQGYSVNESTAGKAADKGDLSSQGPVRMARFAFVSGNVTWRDGATGEWSQATVNMPVRQGAEVFVLKGGRADVQFDDGSELRLGNGALVTLKTLFSDSKGEFTQIEMKEGLATLHSRHPDSVYQIDTPAVSVKSAGAAQARIGIASGTEISVQMGSANIEGSRGKIVVQEGNYLYLPSSDSAYMLKPTPAPDAWDRWNGERNQILGGGANSNQHVPANIGLVAGDLDTYGVWHKDATNGWVWTPSNQAPDWRPYSDGSWVWEDPFGWTWVSREPWGWAPYHYGTWFQGQYGWSWCPGPYSQYWSPGVVSFSDTGTSIAWAPLCPWEVMYPSFCGLGLWGANWGLNFSIGWCGCYFPFGGGFCEGRRWENGWCNGFRDHGGFGDRGGFGSGGRFGNGAGGNFGSGGRLGNGGAFVPANARNGTTTASHAGFGGSSSYQHARNGGALFGSGHTIAASNGASMVSGPANVQPTANARTANRSFTTTRPSSVAASRGTYQGSLPASVSRSVSVQRSVGNVRTGFQSGANIGAAEAASRARASLGYSGSSFSHSMTSGSFGRSYTGGFGGSRSFSGYSGPSRSFGGYGGRSSATGGFAGGRSSSGGFSSGRTGGGFSGGHSSGGGGSTGGGHSGGGRR